MIINIDDKSLTAVIVDDAENPTKRCVIGNWNPVERRKWINREELQKFAALACKNENYFSDYSPSSEVSPE